SRCPTEMSDSTTVLTCLRVSSSPTASAMAWIRPLLLIDFLAPPAPAVFLLAMVPPRIYARAAPRRTHIGQTIHGALFKKSEIRRANRAFFGGRPIRRPGRGGADVAKLRNFAGDFGDLGGSPRVARGGATEDGWRPRRTIGLN